MAQKPFLNLGAGRIILPGPRPAHHGLVDPAIYDFPCWHNVDRNPADGIDECVDLFTYPWPFKSDSYDGALMTHIAEHIPHDIRLASETPQPPDGMLRYVEPSERARLQNMQDGWYAFFAELYRVLTPGAQVYVLSPYGWSNGGIHDPSHTRLLTPDSFAHSMVPNPDAPFAYETGGIHFEIRDVRLGLTSYFQHLAGNDQMLQHALATQINVCHEFYVRLECIK